MLIVCTRCREPIQGAPVPHLGHNFCRPCAQFIGLVPGGPMLPNVGDPAKRPTICKEGHGVERNPEAWGGHTYKGPRVTTLG